MAPKIVTRVTDGMALSAATEKTLDEMKPYDGFAGIIGISANGDIYHADTTLTWYGRCMINKPKFLRDNIYLFILVD